MAERNRIAQRHKAGSIGNLIHGNVPCYVRDHKRDNVKALRELERRLRHKKEQMEARAGAEEFKLKQFRDIPSRLHQTPTRQRSQLLGSPDRDSSGFATPLLGTPSPNRRPQSAGARVLSPGASSPWARAPPRGLSPPRVERSRSSVRRPPRSPAPIVSDVKCEEDDFELDAAELERAVERSQRQSLWKNAAKDTIPDGGVTHPSWWPAAPSEAQAAEVPLGYRLMPEEERLETLEGLQQKLAELDEKYARLPLKIETEGQRKQQQMLRTKIAETEDAVKLFSRTQVLVET